MSLIPSSVVGGVRPVRVPAQGRGSDHPGADRPHEAVHRAVRHGPRVCDHGGR